MRSEGSFANGGDTIRCLAQISRDGATWEDDLAEASQLGSGSMPGPHSHTPR
jgi:hypothetical protein